MDSSYTYLNQLSSAEGTIQASIVATGGGRNASPIRLVRCREEDQRMFEGQNGVQVGRIEVDAGQTISIRVTKNLPLGVHNLPNPADFASATFQLDNTTLIDNTDSLSSNYSKQILTTEETISQIRTEGMIRIEVRRAISRGNRSESVARKMGIVQTFVFFYGPRVGRSGTGRSERFIIKGEDDKEEGQEEDELMSEDEDRKDDILSQGEDGNRTGQQRPIQFEGERHRRNLVPDDSLRSAVLGDLSDGSRASSSNLIAEEVQSQASSSSSGRARGGSSPAGGRSESPASVVSQKTFVKRKPMNGIATLCRRAPISDSTFYQQPGIPPPPPPPPVAPSAASLAMPLGLLPSTSTKKPTNSTFATPRQVNKIALRSGHSFASRETDSASEGDMSDSVSEGGNISEVGDDAMGSSVDGEPNHPMEADRNDFVVEDGWTSCDGDDRSWRGSTDEDEAEGDDDGDERNWTGSQLQGQELPSKWSLTGNMELDGVIIDGTDKGKGKDVQELTIKQEFSADDPDRPRSPLFNFGPRATDDAEVEFVDVVVSSKGVRQMLMKRIEMEIVRVETCGRPEQRLTIWKLKEELHRLEQYGTVRIPAASGGRVDVGSSKGGAAPVALLDHNIPFPTLNQSLPVAIIQASKRRPDSMVAVSRTSTDGQSRVSQSLQQSEVAATTSWSASGAAPTLGTAIEPQVGKVNWDREFEDRIRWIQNDMKAAMRQELRVVGQEDKILEQVSLAFAAIKSKRLENNRQLRELESSETANAMPDQRWDNVVLWNLETSLKDNLSLWRRTLRADLRRTVDLLYDLPLAPVDMVNVLEAANDITYKGGGSGPGRDHIPKPQASKPPPPPRSGPNAPIQIVVTHPSPTPPLTSPIQVMHPSADLLHVLPTGKGRLPKLKRKRSGSVDLTIEANVGRVNQDSGPPPLKIQKRQNGIEIENRNAAVKTKFGFRMFDRQLEEDEEKARANEIGPVSQGGTWQVRPRYLALPVIKAAAEGPKASKVVSTVRSDDQPRTGEGKRKRFEDGEAIQPPSKRLRGGGLDSMKKFDKFCFTSEAKASIDQNTWDRPPKANGRLSESESSWRPTPTTRSMILRVVSSPKDIQSATADSLKNLLGPVGQQCEFGESHRATADSIEFFLQTRSNTFVRPFGRGDGEFTFLKLPRADCFRPLRLACHPSGSLNEKFLRRCLKKSFPEIEWILRAVEIEGSPARQWEVEAALKGGTDLYGTGWLGKRKEKVLARGGVQMSIEVLPSCECDLGQHTKDCRGRLRYATVLPGGKPRIEKGGVPRKHNS